MMSDTKPEGVSWASWAKKAAIAAFAGATGVLGVLVIAVTASSDGGTAITTPEWLQAATVALTAIGGTFGVYVARNQTQPSVAVRPKRDEFGFASDPLHLLIWFIVFVVVIAFAVWLVRLLLPGA